MVNLLIVKCVCFLITSSVPQSPLTNEYACIHNSFHNLSSISNLVMMATCEQVRNAGLLSIYQVCYGASKMKR